MLKEPLKKVAVWTTETENLSKAKKTALELDLPFSNDAELLLQFSENKWQLSGHYQGAPKTALSVDFIQGKNAWRKKNPGAGKQPLAQAVGIKQSKRPTVLDCTAGLGRDAFILASLGCKVWLTERNPVIKTLLIDGLKRALVETDNHELFSKSMIYVGETIDQAKQQLTEPPDVIYMDPMYPHPPSKKTAKVKKDMQLLRYLIEADTDTHLWLEKARSWVKKVVVKRPDWAEPIAQDVNGYTQSKGHRFDIYLGKNN